MEKKTVTLDNGKDTLSYEKLVLATGGTPRRLPIEGANLENVYTFRGVPDSQKVDAGWFVLLLAVLQSLIKMFKISCS